MNFWQPTRRGDLWSPALVAFAMLLFYNNATFARFVPPLDSVEIQAYPLPETGRRGRRPLQLCTTLLRLKIASLGVGSSTLFGCVIPHSSLLTPHLKLPHLAKTPP